MGDFWGPGAKRLSSIGTIISVFRVHAHLAASPAQGRRASRSVNNRPTGHGGFAPMEILRSTLGCPRGTSQGTPLGTPRGPPGDLPGSPKGYQPGTPQMRLEVLQAASRHHQGPEKGPQSLERMPKYHIAPQPRVAARQMCTPRTITPMCSPGTLTWGLGGSVLGVFWGCSGECSGGVLWVF